MLAHFYIDPESVPNQRPVDRAARSLLLREIEEHGIAAGPRKNWLEILRRIPQSERKEWETTLRSLPIHDVSLDFHSPGDVTTILDSGTYSIVALTEEGLETWERETGTKVDPARPVLRQSYGTETPVAEVLTIGLLSETESLSNFREWNRNGIRNGDSRDQLWETRILPVLELSHSLNIVDRYFLKSLLAGSTKNQKVRDSAVHWLVSKFEQDLADHPISLTIYTNKVSDLADLQVESTLLNHLREFAPNGIREIHCFVAKPNLREAIPHDRHWRTASQDWSSKFEFGSSVDLFNNSRIQGDYTMRYSNLNHRERRALVDQEQRSQTMSFPEILVT